MSSTKSSPKRNGKASSNEGLLDFDLLHHLTYLSAVSAAGVGRGQLFDLASQLPLSTSGYFAEIEDVAKNMNYEYSEACRIVGEKTKNEEMQSLLMRLAAALSSGEPEMDFLNQEVQVQAEMYGNAYERKLESLKKWSDGYTALIISASLIVVVAIISTMIYDLGLPTLMSLVVVTILVSGLGAWIIHISTPKEVKPLVGPDAEASDKLPRLFFTITVPATLVASALMTVLHIPVGWILLVDAVMLFPLGIVGARHDDIITARDRDIPTFLHVLGSTASALGTTLGEVMGRIDLRSLPHLAPAIKRLHGRLQAQVLPDLCWQHFVAESGSELIGRSVRVFLDGVKMGGDAGEVGARASVLAMKLNLLRAKRRIVSNTFGWLTLVMHVTMAFLLVFITQIVGGFGKMIQEVAAAAQAQAGEMSSMSNAFSFNFQNVAIFQWLMSPVVILMAVTNAVACHAADGGYFHKFWFHLSLMLIATAAAILIAPEFMRLIFKATPVIK